MKLADYQVDFNYLSSGTTWVNIKRRIINCIVVSPIGVYYTADAICHPDDSFNKETGRKIALTRAIKSLPKDERRKIWEAYFKR